MRKKIVKMIEQSLPRLYDENGVVYSKGRLATKILDKLPNPERLGLLPFEQFIPFECSACPIYNGYKKGCLYLFFDETYHVDNRPPDNCPLGY